MSGRTCFYSKLHLRRGEGTGGDASRSRRLSVVNFVIS
jgi:hypothetical protein